MRCVVSEGLLRDTKRKQSTVAQRPRREEGRGTALVGFVEDEEAWTVEDRMNQSRNS